jgi:excisionase family DNA binding protein
MVLNIEALPEQVKLEVSKSDLIAFAHTLIEQAKTQSATPSVSEKDIMTVEEAAKFLNLAKQTLYGMTSRNDIPFLKRRRKIYFSQLDLERWLLEGKQKTRAEIQAEVTEFIQSQKNKRTK